MCYTQVTGIINFDAPVVPNLASGSPFKLASALFGAYAPVFEFCLLSGTVTYLGYTVFFACPGTRIDRFSKDPGSLMVGDNILN